MADVFSVAKRSEVMQRIRGSGNETTELSMVRLLRQNGLSGWRRHRTIHWPLLVLTPALQTLRETHRLRCSARPDFVFPKAKVALFIDGCFWHSCPKHATKPISNHEFWLEKLARNQVRDRFVTASLRRAGWVVIRVWEHELGRPARLLSRLSRALDIHPPSPTIVGEIAPAAATCAGRFFLAVSEQRRSSG